jgi:hypothetical protein
MSIVTWCQVKPPTLLNKVEMYEWDEIFASRLLVIFFPLLIFNM